MSLTEKKDVARVGILEGFLYPARWEAYRKYQAELLEETKKKAKEVRIKVKRGDSPEEINKARLSAKEAYKKAKKAILG